MRKAHYRKRLKKNLRDIFTEYEKAHALERKAKRHRKRIETLIQERARLDTLLNNAKK